MEAEFWIFASVKFDAPPKLKCQNWQFSLLFRHFLRGLGWWGLDFCTKVLLNTANVTMKSNFKNVENSIFGRILNFEILVFFGRMAKIYLLPQFSSKFNETWQIGRKQLWQNKFGSGILIFFLSQIWQAPKFEVPKLAIFATFAAFSHRL